MNIVRSLLYWIIGVFLLIKVSAFFQTVIFERHTCTLLSIHIIKELIVQRSEHFIEI